MTLDHATIVSFGTRLPPSLGVLGRLQVQLADAGCDLDDIVELVRIDPALTFQVIKLANSALFGLGSRCESLESAVARVGFGEIQQIVALAVSRQTFQGELLAYEIAGGRLWENAVAIGALNAELSVLAGGDAGAAYVTGLLRNLGKVVLNNFAPQVRYPGEKDAPDVFAWETQQHGQHAGHVSAVLLEHWRFSGETVGTVHDHRDPMKANRHRASAARLHLACGFAAEWGCALPGESTLWSLDEAAAARAGLRPEHLADAVVRAKERFVKCSMLEWSHEI